MIEVLLRSGEVRNQCVIDDLPSLLWAVNLGAMELHAFASAGARLEQPAFVVLDLDPGPGTGLGECCQVAIQLRALLTIDALQSFCKTSGRLGLHIYVPLAAGHSFEETKSFARSLAARLVDERPHAVTDRRDSSARGGRVLIDWIPNSPRALTVTAYSLRAADVPSVSTPVGWEEVETTALGDVADGLRFGPQDVLQRASSKGDLFEPVLELRQRLPGVPRTLS